MPEHFPLPLQPRGVMSQQGSLGNNGCLYQTQPTPQARRARSNTGCFLLAQNENLLSTDMVQQRQFPFFPSLSFSSFHFYLEEVTVIFKQLLQLAKEPDTRRKLFLD